MTRILIRRVRTAVVAACLALASAPTVHASIPAIFDSRPYDEASSAAAGAGKLFIVDFTAVWCGPCKQMDRTTWIDESVTAWIRDHAIIVQVDVDEQQKIARDLRIEAMPTVVVFKDGAEFDRSTGYKDAGALVSWLEGVQRGEREIDALEKAARAEGPVDVQARYRLASELARRGELDRAADEFVWLWDNMLEHAPSMSGVRLSFMAGEMERLAARHEPARARFAALRDRDAAKLAGKDKSYETLNDFVHLNTIVGEPERTLAWYDGVKDDPKNRRAVELVAGSLEPLLLEHGRWADLGRLVEDPAETFAWDIRAISDPAMMDGVPEEMVDRFKEMQVGELRGKFAGYYAGCLAADREAQASALAALALKHIDDAAMRRALVATALEAGEPRQAHFGWLDQAAAAGEDTTELRQDLTAALAAGVADAIGEHFGDVAWLTGTWRAVNDQGTWDEVWLAPEGNCMSGTLRWVQDGEVRLYEQLAIERAAGAESSKPEFTMFIRHFNPGLVPWTSEADGPIRLALKSATATEQVWEGGPDHAVRVTYTLGFPGALTVRVETKEADGSWHERVMLEFTRAG